VSLRRLRGWLEHPTDPSELWIAVDETTGACHGWYRLTLPERENRGRGYLWVTVQPSSRRRGLGTTLLQHAVDRAAAGGGRCSPAGRRRARPARPSPPAWARPPGWLRPGGCSCSAGSRPAGSPCCASRPPGRRRLLAGALDGRIPDEYVARYAELENAMADAPHDAGEENVVWDADRVRAEIDDNRELQGRRVYTLAALHDASGEMAR